MGKLVNFLKACVTLIEVIIIAIINFVVITRISNVTMRKRTSEYVSVSGTHYLWVIFLILLVVVGILFYRWAQKIYPKWLFLGLTVITVIAGLYLIKAAPRVLRFDQYLCLVSATNLNNHNYIDFRPIGGYLDKYPYQLGFVTFERLIVSKSGRNAVLGIFCLNLVAVVGINLMLWQITRLIFKNKVIENYQILFNFLFIPELLYVLFAYGTLFGFAFMLAGMFFTLRQWQEKRKLDWLWSAICLVIAYQLKSNYSIGIIAVVIWSLVYFIKDHKWQYICLIVASLGLVVGSNNVINHYYSQLTGKEISVSKGVPKNLFVVMGLSKNQHRSDGWYNRYTIKIYKKYRGDYTKSKAQGQKDLKKRLDEMKSKPADTVNFFKEKFVTTWGNPLFQSIWSGPHVEYKQPMKSKLLNELYNKPKSKPYRFLVNFAHAFYAWALISILIGLIMLLKKHQTIPTGAVLLITYFIGGVLFHLIWETKSQYVINYFLALLPIAGLGAEILFRKINHLFVKKKG